MLCKISSLFNSFLDLKQNKILLDNKKAQNYLVQLQVFLKNHILKCEFCIINVCQSLFRAADRQNILVILVFSRLLANRSYVLLKCASFSFSELLTGENYFNKICWSFNFFRMVDQQKLCIINYVHKFSFSEWLTGKMISMKYVDHLFFSQLLTHRNSFDKVCLPFSFLTCRHCEIYKYYNRVKYIKCLQCYT